MALWPWPLTFWPLVFCIQRFPCPTHLPISIILRLSVNELRVLNIWSHFRYLKQSLRMRSITWPVHRRSPKTTRNNFLTRIAYSLYNFYGATMTIKGSLYWIIPMLKRFSVAKNQVQSKSVPEMAVFRKFKGPNIKYSLRDLQNALPYPEPRHLTYFA